MNLLKVLHQKQEQSKVAMSNVRKEVQNIIRETEKAKKISEDYGAGLLILCKKLQTN